MYIKALVNKKKLYSWSNRSKSYRSRFDSDGGAGGGEGAVEANHGEGGDGDGDEKANTEEKQADNIYHGDSKPEKQQVPEVAASNGKAFFHGSDRPHFGINQNQWGKRKADSPD